ncbi:MAG: hypothetical protein JWP89_1740 [Schlesneria sp.]|nr:hypothetical protein [Schlesneria sp.]
MIRILLLQLCVFGYATSADAQLPFASFVGEGGSFLDECGDRLDCYFTLEAVRLTEFEYTCRCYETSWDQNKLPQTKDELVTMLRRGMKDTEVFVDKRNPQVIHIVEKPPADYQRYPLTERVTVDFEGSAPKLVDSLGSSLKSLRLKSGSLIRAGRIPPHDYGTPVKVEAKNAIARDVLTQAIPTTGYSRLMWTATSYRDDEKKWQTQLHLHGPCVIKE